MRSSALLTVGALLLGVLAKDSTTTVETYSTELPDPIHRPEVSALVIDLSSKNESFHNIKTTHAHSATPESFPVTWKSRPVLTADSIYLIQLAPYPTPTSTTLASIRRHKGRAAHEKAHTRKRRGPRDTLVGFLSPKRQRTTGPGPATPANAPTEHDHLFLAPASEPQDKTAQTVLFDKISEKYLSPPGARNPRKRPREDDEFEVGSVVVSPDDSASQIGSRVESHKEEEQSGSLNSSDLSEEEEEGEEEEVEPLDEQGSTGNSSDLSEDEDADIEQEVGSHAEQNTSLGSALTEDEGVEQDDESEEKSSSMNSSALTEDEGIEQEEPEEEEPEEEIPADAKVAEYLARQAELAARREDIEKARAAGDWHADELFLFERIMMRGFEEIIPSHWQIDFPTLPEMLFTSELENTFIQENRSSGSYAVKALQALLRLGIRVRDKIAADRPTEKFIEKQIQDYVRWSEKDGGFDKKRFLPVLTVVAARPNEAIDSISKTITNQMNFLAKKHRDHLGIHVGEEGEIDHIDANKRAPPILYGIIIAQTMAIFVTLDSANLKGKLRHIEHFDFTVKDMDVWNGFALAIMVTVARNSIMAIRDELETDDEPESDVDA
ncbi:hypothetical protein G7Y89_g1801 [Cudoniella acicularis]|uniref:Uncharacterized protein n=1 Tax=Cudoniella acicularis TaxID=354080 RepID=A0A8H4RVM0_9HELO|nr:hypothetical protein G7Y89_g1801 [Cudoniella acicularis]